MNSPDLSEEKFIKNPVENDVVVRLYKTGDLGRWLSNGNIEYQGRKDEQLKIRGYRIEPGEIESVLQECELVSNAVVTAFVKDGSKILIGYVVPKGIFDKTEVMEYLRVKLPEYMVPSIWVELENLPLTPNGKIDKKALPQPEIGEQRSGYEAPGNEIEWMLAKNWEKLLGVERVGINDNFFELGGHSILALQIFGYIEKLTGRKLAISTLFNSPTIKGLSKILKDEDWKPSWRSLVPVKSGGSKLPFFYVPPAAQTALTLQKLIKYIPSDQPVYVLEPLGQDGKEQPHTDLKEMAAFYVKEIQSLQAEGPYLLGGRCFGGRVAFEMAQQLRKAGHEVALLAIFDTWPPFISTPKPYIPPKRDARHFMVRSLHHLRAGALWTVVKNYSAYVYFKTKKGIKEKAEYMLSDSKKKIFDEIRQIHFKAQDRYVASKYPGKITLIECANYKAENKEGWRKLAEEGLESHVIPDTEHTTIMSEPHIKLFAEKLNQILDKTNNEIENRPYSAPYNSVNKINEEKRYLNKTFLKFLKSNIDDKFIVSISNSFHVFQKVTALI
ncbi:MAG: AMP-binding protein [Ignavibacteria bacterium]|nr:AMP-binding protein [Ignavibacteria bacterium]